MTGEVRGDWLGLSPQWCMGIFPNITDLKVAARPAGRSCGKWLELLGGVVAATLHHPGRPPQLQGETWQGVRGPGDAWRGKHTGSFSLGHMGLWVPCWVPSTNLRRVCCVTFCHFMHTCLGRGELLHLGLWILASQLPQPNPNVLLLHEATRLETYSLKTAHCTFLLKLGCRILPRLY